MQTEEMARCHSACRESVKMRVQIPRTSVNGGEAEQPTSDSRFGQQRQGMPRLAIYLRLVILVALELTERPYFN